MRRERHIPLDGITNLRDLGGFATANGGTTRWGRVYRADALHKLTADGLARFHELGVRSVFDLRAETEREAFPNPVDSVHVPITSRPAGELTVAVFAAVGEKSQPDGERMLRDMYVAILEHSRAEIRRILSTIADDSAMPALFHCHGGKDRTGVVAAVLLRALGVSREDVLDDYEATRRYRTIEHQQDSYTNMLASGVSPEAAAGVLGTPRWAMEAALDAIDDHYGGIHRYVTETVGVPAELLEQLRTALVEHDDVG